MRLPESFNGWLRRQRRPPEPTRRGLDLRAVVPERPRSPTPRPEAGGAPRIWRGHCYPLGATWTGKGVNFALFSENATGVDLCLFDRPDDREILHGLGQSLARAAERQKRGSSEGRRTAGTQIFRQIKLMYRRPAVRQSRSVEKSLRRLRRGRPSCPGIRPPRSSGRS